LGIFNSPCNGELDLDLDLKLGPELVFECDLEVLTFELDLDLNSELDLLRNFGKPILGFKE
jgi:hypothetical protein